MLAVAVFVSWPPQTDSDTQSLIGQPLFPTFTDPLAASSLRIVTFDEGRGEVSRFEVAKDEATGVWALPSRNNYPADAAEQMQQAANALVGVKILDIQTENPEDHASLGVVEPKPEALEFGDEGVGRLVAFRGDKNASLATLIIGKRVGDSGDKRYVRIPQQNPVYVVNIEDAVFSTKFEDWIEKDLLQLSSIDISEIEIEHYDAALEPNGSVALNRSYDATLAVDGSNSWDLVALTRYDDQQEPRETALAEGESLATSKLNDTKNALDDLKIVDVAAKPKGMSENLKADKDLVSDNEAVRSLAVRGFFPISSGDVISANGQMSVTLNDGVQYLLRFGNVQGLAEQSEDQAQAEGGAGGANRYLLVTAQVDESKFPPPQLRAIPKSIEELDAMNRADEEMDQPAAEQPAAPVAPAEPAADSADGADTALPTENEVQTEPAGEEAAAAEPAPAPPTDAEPADTEPAATEPAATEPAGTEPADAEPADQPAASADGEISGDGVSSGEATAEGAGQGQDATTEPVAAEAGDEPSEPAVDRAPAAEVEPSDVVREIEPAADDAVETPAPTATDEAAEQPAELEETEEEKQERLEAEQERITKENQRMIDERKDRIEAARRRVRELNGRFADWYYVIPESTYRKLRISLDDLIERPAGDEAPVQFPDDASSAAPTFDFPLAP